MNKLNDEKKEPMVLDTGTVKATSVLSATKAYLIIGITGILLFIGMVASAVYVFFTSPLYEAIGISICLIIGAIFPIMLVFYIPAYKRRCKFVMYLSELNENINWIKEKYHVCFIDENGVIFVEKGEDVQAYRDWKLYHTFTSTAEAEGCFCWREGIRPGPNLNILFAE